MSMVAKIDLGECREMCALDSYRAEAVSLKDMLPML